MHSCLSSPGTSGRQGARAGGGGKAHNPAACPVCDCGTLLDSPLKRWTLPQRTGEGQVILLVLVCLILPAFQPRKPFLFTFRAKDSAFLT